MNSEIREQVLGMVAGMRGEKRAAASGLLAKYAASARTRKAAQPSAYVNFLREYVPEDEIDDRLAAEYGRILDRNSRLFEAEYKKHEPQRHHFNWLWRPKTGPVQKLTAAFRKVEGKLPDSKKKEFRRVADRLVGNINKKTSPFPVFPSYTYTPDEGGARQYGFMVF